MKVVNFAEEKTQPLWQDLVVDGESTMEWFLPGEMSPTIDSALIHFTPGARTKKFQMDIDWLVQISDGKGSVGTDKEQRDVSAGDVVVFERGETRWLAAAPDSTFSFYSTHRPGPEMTTLD